MSEHERLEIMQRLETFHELHPDFAFTLPSPEPSPNSEFRKVVSPGMRMEILEFVHGKFPDRDAFVSSRETVNTVFEQVQDNFRRYFAIHGTGIPSWLN
jgi:hypothetical protein